MPIIPPYRFAVVTHIPNMAQIMRYFTDDPDFTLEFFPFSYHNPLLAAQQLLERGYEVILYYSSLGPSILNELGRSIILIHKTNIDIIKALMEAKKIGSRIALTLNRDDNFDTTFVEKLLGIQIMEIRFDSLASLSDGLRDAIADGMDVLVGGGMSASMAKEHGIPFIRIEPNLPSISLAIAQAKAMAHAQREDRDRLDKLVAVLKLFREGVLCVNEQGATVFSNTKAAELLRVSQCDRNGPDFSRYHKALMISDVLTDGEPREDYIVKIHGEQFVVTTLPISVHSGLQGAVAFISNIDDIHNMASQLRKSQRTAGFVAHFRLEDMRGGSPVMLRLKRMARLYAPHDVAILIHGETGSGKELLAQSLHNASPRARHPFVAVNCAALPESLLESELFGYAEGAFTGARRGGKPGVFEMAHKGTLFLDEIGDMGLETQLRLLRILETKELVRVGGDRVIPVDIRIISASHKPLQQLVQENRFRRDLFYRLAALRLHIPPLRERLSDIPLLLEDLLKRYGKSINNLTPTMLKAIREYSWPGNIRELQSFMESYLILLGSQSTDEALFLELLASWSCDHEGVVEGEPLSKALLSEADLKSQLAQVRRDIVKRMLRKAGGNKRLAASRLGISYNTLWRILEGDS